MWNCDKCGFTNDDLTNVCAQCGATRSVGRFGNRHAPTAYAPQSAPAQTGYTAQAAPASTPQTPAAANYRPPRAIKHPGRGFVRTGVFLSVLLFLLAAVIAWRQYDVLSAAVLGLILGNIKTHSLLIVIPLYVILAFAASLTAALPGLILVGIGKCLRQLARIRDRL